MYPSQGLYAASVMALLWFWLRLGLMWVIGHPQTKRRPACGIGLGLVGTRASNAAAGHAYTRSLLLCWAWSSVEAWLVLLSPVALRPKGKASLLPAECRSPRCVFNQQQGWESLLGLDAELIVSLTPAVERERKTHSEGWGWWHSVHVRCKEVSEGHPL